MKNIMIATPCYNGIVTTQYMNSMIIFVRDCVKNNIDFGIIQTTQESLITRARNTLVAQFLASSYEYLLFIDADIAFNSQDIFKLLNSNKQIITGVYPVKGLYFEQMRDPTLHPFQQILTYPVNNVIKHENSDIYEVEYAPTGFMLIHRSVFDKMKTDYQELKYNNDIFNITTDANKDNFYTFFDAIIDEKTKYYLSEDYTFCQRARKSGFNIFIDSSIELGHIGNMLYPGNIVSLNNHLRNKK